MKFKSIITLLSITVILGINCSAEERVAVKTNILYDALYNANLGIEFRVAPHWSIDISGNYNGWELSHGRQWKHWMVQPELRYWLRDKNLRGHFFAGHLFGGQFNSTLKQFRRQGWAAGIGVGYGYSWRFGSHWGVETEIAVGYARYGYDKFPCSECGRKIATRNKNYVGPTKAAVSLVYYFGSSKKVEPAVIIQEEPAVETVEITVADTLPKFDFPLVDVPHSKVLTENLVGVARVQFRINRTDIDTTFADNRTELSSISDKIDSVSNNLGMEIHRIELTGYASPEGSYSNNDRIAYERTKAVRNYILSEKHLADSIIWINHVAEDWEGLLKAILSSALDDKVELLDIIDSDMSFDAKEARLRNHGASWAWISKKILPGLRRTAYRIEYQHQYEEVELQTLETVNRCISEGNINEAAKLLVDIPSSPESDYARGVVEALQHRYAQAEAWFLRARSRGVKESDEALKELKNKITIHY